MNLGMTHSCGGVLPKFSTYALSMVYRNRSQVKNHLEKKEVIIDR